MQAGKRRARERGACPPGRAPEHSRGNTRAAGSSRVRKRVGEVVRFGPPARGAGKARRGLKSMSARCTCHDARLLWTPGREASVASSATTPQVVTRVDDLQLVKLNTYNAHYIIGFITRESHYGSSSSAFAELTFSAKTYRSTRQCYYLFPRSEGIFRTRNVFVKKEESLGLASTEERRIRSDKEPSLCRRACAPARFMLEMHLMVRMHPSEVRMMNDASCILVPRRSRVCTLISRGTLKAFIFNSSS